MIGARVENRTPDLPLTRRDVQVDLLHFAPRRKARHGVAFAEGNLLHFTLWCRVSDSNRRPTAYRTTSAFAA